ncbi:hypothetical protein ACFVRR_23455 [Gottfriedia sp. NPDC057948]|uniref:hypothetical protein n=1 Tax=Gottfriedia sp. NPDC057948 TaxID=3346287 RepID=UPI0036DC15A8
MSYLLEFKNVIVITIIATILGSIIPMKSHAEEIVKPSNEKTINQVSTQSSLTAQSILIGRVVNTKYSQMPITAVYNDGASPISFAANTLIPFYDLNQEDENTVIFSNNLDFAQTNRLLNLGFTDSEIETMSNEEYEINKDLKGEVISTNTNYIKIIEPRVTIAYSISNNEPIIKELDEETYYDEINKLNDTLKSRASSDFSTTSYKKMTTTITKLSSKEYRLKNSVVWSKLPSQTYVDVIGIGINSSYWAPNPGTQYGQQNWTTYPTIGNPSKSKSAEYTKDSNKWKKGAGGYALKINLPDNKAKGIDSEYLKTLSSYMYYSVGSLTNTKRLDAYGNYAHQNSSYTLTPSIALSGISFSVSPAKKFSFHPDTHSSITW